uniref:Uncharacterized protein n=1 Tax=Cacopsylla melanoneura TaxID=428564 RepID=A0A8D8W3E8_9HEMI
MQTLQTLDINQCLLWRFRGRYKIQAKDAQHLLCASKGPVKAMRWRMVLEYFVAKVESPQNNCYFHVYKQSSCTHRSPRQQNHTLNNKTRINNNFLYHYLKRRSSIFSMSFVSKCLKCQTI